MAAWVSEGAASHGLLHLVWHVPFKAASPDPQANIELWHIMSSSRMQLIYEGKFGLYIYVTAAGAHKTLVCAQQQPANICLQTTWVG